MNLLLKLLAKLLFLIQKLSANKEEPTQEATFAEAFAKSQEIVDALELIGSILADTADWKKLKAVGEELHLDGTNLKDLKLQEIRAFYESALYKLESLRDELQYVTYEVNKYGLIEDKRKSAQESSINLH